MKSSLTKILAHFLFAGLFLIIIGCSGDDKSTNPDNQGEPTDPPGTVVLLSVDFESAVSGWEGIPQQISKTSSNDWSWNNCTGTSTILNEGSVGITSDHAKSGSKSLFFEAKNGLYSTFSHTYSSYNVDRCYYTYDDLTARLIRRFSLLDYSADDQASLSLSIKPVYITKSALENAESSFKFRILVYGAHGTIKDTSLNYSFLENNIGDWKEVQIDLSSYTGWEDDIGLMIELAPSRIDDQYAIYCYDFCYSAYVPYCDVHDEGDSSKCMVAIDDLKFKVIPNTGK